MPPCYILSFALHDLERGRRFDVLWEERVRDSGVLHVHLNTKNMVDVRRAQNSAQAAIRLLSNCEETLKAGHSKVSTQNARRTCGLNIQ